MHDLPQNVISRVKLYADDVLLYTTIHSKDDCLVLQEDLNIDFSYGLIRGKCLLILRNAR